MTIAKQETLNEMNRRGSKRTNEETERLMEKTKVLKEVYYERTNGGNNNDNQTTSK